MKVCGGCTTEFDEEFKFCPDCGRAFGVSELANQLNENLNQMKRQAEFEGALSRRVFSGAGLGDAQIGRTYGQ
jgi:uncharacterized membrane protein YvbJ